MSNETLKVSPEKIKLALSSRRAIVILAAFVALIGLYLVVTINSENSYQSYVVLNQSRYDVELASTEAEQILGLSGRMSLAKGTGMLFVFAKPVQQCFWMKDMRFSIDIAWFDIEGRVLDVRADLSPKTYPKQYCPAAPSTYVLEVPAGTFEECGVKTGDYVEINP